MSATFRGGQGDFPSRIELNLPRCSSPIIRPGIAATAAGSLFKSRWLLEEEALREFGQGIIFDRIEQPTHFVRVHLARAALPDPHGVLDRVQKIPCELASPVLKPAALEEPLDDRNGHYDPDDLGSEIHQEGSHGRLDSEEEGRPQHDRGDDEEATGYERSKHDAILRLFWSDRHREDHQERCPADVSENR